MNKIYFTNEELILIKDDLSNKISRTERELEEKEHSSIITEMVNEQLERRKKIVTYLESKIIKA